MKIIIDPERIAHTLLIAGLALGTWAALLAGLWIIYKGFSI